MPDYIAGKHINKTIIYSCLLFFFLVNSPAAKLVSRYKLIPESALAQNLFIDDHTRDSLQKAIDSSIAYYNKLPPDRSVEFDRTYRVDEIKKSLELFKLIINSNDRQTIRQAILKNFNIFKIANSSTFTAYYSYQLHGSSVKTDYYYAPVFARPDDIISKKKNHTFIRGKLKNGKFIPYDKAEKILFSDSYHKNNKALFYANLADLLLAQMEGSAHVTLENGEQFFIGYAIDNGHPFRRLSDLLQGKCETSAEGMRTYMQTHPLTLKKLVKKIPRYIFFEKKPFATGSLDTELVAERSLAMDMRYIPPGSLVFLTTSGNEKLNRFALVHDSGALIQGSGIIDVYRNHQNIGAIKMKEQGSLYLLLPKKQKVKEL